VNTEGSLYPSSEATRVSGSVDWLR
jgi:hypothetical protein